MNIFLEFLRLKAIEIGKVLVIIILILIGLALFLLVCMGVGVLISLIWYDAFVYIVDEESPIWLATIQVGVMFMWISGVGTLIGYAVFVVIPKWLKSNWKQAKRNVNIKRRKHDKIYKS